MRQAHAGNSNAEGNRRKITVPRAEARALVLAMAPRAAGTESETRSIFARPFRITMLAVVGTMRV